ncbi:MAG: hypothetical protein ACLVGL_11655, partial [Waltera sp.]
LRIAMVNPDSALLPAPEIIRETRSCGECVFLRIWQKVKDTGKSGRPCKTGCDGIGRYASWYLPNMTVFRIFSKYVEKRPVI